jgi:DNA-binding NarL/FixJ family response regulator
VRVAIGMHSPLFLEALSRSMRHEGLLVCAAATTPGGLVIRSREADRPPEVALLDATLASGDVRMRFLSQVRRGLPGTRVVVLVPDLTPELAQATLEQEVEGVVLAEASARELADSLSRVAAGHAIFPARWLGAMRSAEHTSLFAQLSARQIQVLELLSAGLTNHEIAEQLTLSRNTVKSHVLEIYGRLGVANRVQAAALLARASNGSSRPEHVSGSRDVDGPEPSSTPAAVV